MLRIAALALAAVCVAACTKNSSAPTERGTGTTFFVTSSRSTTGNLGGLRGADAICQNLATAVGAGNKTWRAYLSVERDADNGNRPTDARSRIGTGPWFNAKGVMLASNLTALHALKGDATLFVDEKGEPINGQWVGSPSPVEHDILTGSAADGTLLAGLTCGDWTSDSTTAIGAGRALRWLRARTATRPARCRPGTRRTRTRTARTPRRAEAPAGSTASRRTDRLVARLPLFFTLTGERRACSHESRRRSCRGQVRLLAALKGCACTRASVCAFLLVAQASGLPRGGPSFASPTTICVSTEGESSCLYANALAGMISSSSRSVRRAARRSAVGARGRRAARAAIASPATSTGGRRSAAGSATTPPTPPIFRRSATGSASSRGSSIGGSIAAARCRARRPGAPSTSRCWRPTSTRSSWSRRSGRISSARRLERYLTMVWDAGAVPVVLLNKSDLSDGSGSGARRRCVRGCRWSTCSLVSALQPGELGGLDALAPYLRPAQTVALLGSSGVGKSTLDQPPARPRGAEDRRDQRRGREGPAYDDVAAAGGAAGRGAADRHAGHARAAAVGRRRRGRRGVRRHHGAGGRVPLRGLRARGRAGMRRARRRRRRAASTPTASRTTAASGAKRRSRSASGTRRPPRRRSGGGSRSIRRRGRSTAIAIADSGRMRGMRVCG